MTSKPAPFSAYTTPEFWNDPHISARMLDLHLDPEAVPASRPHRFIDASAAWIAAEFDIGRGTSVLDLGCGPGLYAERLAAAGATVRGIDVSARSLAHARATAAARGLASTFVHGSYLDAELGTGHDLAIMIYEDYCALSPAQRGLLLRRVRVALRPGGSMLADMTAAPRFATLTEDRVTEPDLMGGFWAPTPYVGTRESWRYDELRLGVDHYVIERDGATREYWNWTQCLTPEEATAEAAAAGLEVEQVLGDVSGAPYDPSAHTFAVVMRKARED
ncbi:class I SAM-dependent methyltransferase [Demequina mangrovi]|uniref:2-polyprenyl-3-methyl-5-hydroxy-6-metoxy-1,4-benzoquinol methylase n=1 Tax=Demequina mangrovi TaxID=1043493 RepID=A0A1H7A682_9MICO|nr:methyltransferase domain-containing protein [Demequina mangrovi]SEJ60938.1 2-polyprenyl-3-methyl-5-hydroxy-6-metoxy-1,4-benzoquinol methylase [Demequina mangrovi]